MNPEIPELKGKKFYTKVALKECVDQTRFEPPPPKEPLPTYRYVDISEFISEEIE